MLDLGLRSRGPAHVTQDLWWQLLVLTELLNFLGLSEGRELVLSCIVLLKRGRGAGCWWELFVLI